MSKSKTVNKTGGVVAVGCDALLSALVEWENKHTTTSDLMSIEMFSDGSGCLQTLQQGDIF